MMNGAETTHVSRRARDAFVARFGPGAEPRPLSGSGRTWLVDRGPDQLVLKRFETERSPAAYVPLFEQLDRMGVGPRLRDVIELPDEWYAVFNFVRGESPNATDAQWDALWPQAVALLGRLRACRSLPAFDLHLWWIKLFQSFDFHDAPADLLKRRLLASSVPGPFGLAHGDFSPQNFLATPTGLMLVDWEEAGRAPVGFDAGWLLVLGELGVTPRRTPSQLLSDVQPLGLAASMLKWSFRLGLLRLFWRARTMSMPADSRVAMITRLRQLVTRELESPAP